MKTKVGPRKYILKSESGARQQKGRWTLLGLCDRELELVGHDHGSENNVFQSKKEKEKSFPSKKKISPRFEFKIKLSL